MAKAGFDFGEHYKHEKHNNCVPCLKAGKNHWNWVKEYHPDIFAEWLALETKLKAEGKANMLPNLTNNGKLKTFEIDCNGFFCSVNDYGNLIEDGYGFLKDYFHLKGGWHDNNRR